MNSPWSSISAQNVVDLYRSILGRDPETPEIVVEQIGLGSVEAVAFALVNSVEFRLKRNLESRAIGNLRLLRCFDFELYVPEGDWMFDDVERDAVYEPYVIEAFREKCAGRTVMDVGANIGIFSLSAAKVTDKPIIAVEASPENAKLIVINAKHNEADNIRVVPAAAASEIGMAKFQRAHTANKVTRDYDLSAETVDTIDVTTALPLDMVVREPVDVLKIDIEGYEWNALQGAGQLMSGKPTVFLEFSPEFMRDGAGIDADTFLKFFFGRGYEATILHRDMSRENVGQDVERLVEAWKTYKDRNVTHLDLMMQ